MCEKQIILYDYAGREIYEGDTVLINYEVRMSLYLDVLGNVD